MQKIVVSWAKPGMITEKNVFGADGQLLLRSGIKLTDYYIKRLKDLGVSAIYVKNPHFKGIEIPEIIREETRVKAIKTVQEAFLGFRASQKIDMKQFQNLAGSVLEEVVKNKHTMVHLLDIRTHDDYTYGHSVNVCVLSVLTGIGLGYNEQKLRELTLGALLHDIGKMLVPVEILNKLTRLLNEEMEVMKTHAALGFDMLRKHWHNIPLLSAHVAFQHHERYDGSGYPRGLKGVEIHEYSQIVAIADVYDALISDKAYKPGMQPHEAYELMIALGSSYFNPDILQVFFKSIAIFPLGSVVQLNNGQVGVIIRVYPGLQTRPVVKLIADESGKVLPETQEIDLVRHLTTFVQKVLREEDIFKLGIMTAVFKDMAKGLQEKEYLTDALGKYVTKDIASVILKKGMGLAELRTATILFADIKDYTSLSERLYPEEVVELLNDYFSRLVEIISGYKGIVNKFIGDSVMAIFNVPLDDSDHARNATRAALEIQRVTRQKGFGKGRIILPTRIGINTGKVVAGNIGSKDRLEYTVIGDPVNVASRLEQLNKNYNSVDILVGQTTYEIVKNDFVFQLIGAIKIKGKTNPINAYKLIR